MFLVQILLPLYDNNGRAVPRETFARVRDELTARYGGVTMFLRSPAHGTWIDGSGAVERDEIVICEVMVDTLDREWWASYRRTLEKSCGQQELVIRATETYRL